MRRYWIEKQDLVNDEVHFRGDVFHHVFGVCRQEDGSKFEVLTDDGKAYFVQVTAVGKKDARAAVLEERVIAPLRNPLIQVVLSIPRFPVMEAVLEKCVELGVHSVQPVFSDFSFVRTEAVLSENKRERWQKIVRSATQQSGRGELLQIRPVVKMDDFLRSTNRTGPVAGLFAYEGPSTLGNRQELTHLKAQRPEGLREIQIFVGSEGGFSDREVALFGGAGLKPVTLGPQVLRVETACMALVSVLKYEFDLMC